MLFWMNGSSNAPSSIKPSQMS
uniref:Uncharacterized protein n=1 Tax=Anguilla anguilla TaxID=7936 RepID=A0A0E9UE47_ANGAN